MNLIKYFKILNNSDLEFIQYYYNKLLTNIQNLITNNISEENEIEILLLLFPFIKNIELLNNIQNLNEIYLEKDSFGNFIYTNWQYDHCYYNSNEIDKNAIKYDSNPRQQIIDNYKFLLLTLENINHRLFVNWNNIYPLGVSTINNYKQSKIYLETIIAVNKGIFQLHNYETDIIQYKHLYVGTIYNVIFNYLFVKI